MSELHPSEAGKAGIAPIGGGGNETPTAPKKVTLSQLRIDVEPTKEMVSVAQTPVNRVLESDSSPSMSPASLSALATPLPADEATLTGHATQAVVPGPKGWISKAVVKLATWWASWSWSGVWASLSCCSREPAVVEPREAPVVLTSAVKKRMEARLKKRMKARLKKALTKVPEYELAKRKATNGRPLTEADKKCIKTICIRTMNEQMRLSAKLAEPPQDVMTQQEVDANVQEVVNTFYDVHDIVYGGAELNAPSNALRDKTALLTAFKNEGTEYHRLSHRLREKYKELEVTASEGARQAANLEKVRTEINELEAKLIELEAKLIELEAKLIDCETRLVDLNDKAAERCRTLKPDQDQAKPIRKTQESYRTAAEERCTELEERAEKACGDVLKVLLRCGTDVPPTRQEMSESMVNAHVATWRYVTALGHYRNETIDGSVYVEELDKLMNDLRPPLDKKDRSQKRKAILLDEAFLAVMVAISNGDKLHQDHRGRDTGQERSYQTLAVTMMVLMRWFLPEAWACGFLFDRLPLYVNVFYKVRKTPVKGDGVFLVRALAKLKAQDEVTSHLVDQRLHEVEEEAKTREAVGKNMAETPAAEKATIHRQEPTNRLGTNN